jgi:hypothetical protein
MSCLSVQWVDLWLHYPNCFHTARRETFTLYKLQRAGWDQAKNTCRTKYVSVIWNSSLLIRSRTSPIHQPHSCCLSAPYKQQARIRSDVVLYHKRSLRSFTAKLTEIINSPEERGIMSLRNTDIQFQDYVTSKLIRWRCEWKLFCVRFSLPTFEWSNTQLRKPSSFLRICILPHFVKKKKVENHLSTLSEKGSSWRICKGRVNCGGTHLYCTSLVVTLSLETHRI